MNSNLHTVNLKCPSTPAVGNSRFAHASLLGVSVLLLGPSALVGCGADERDTPPLGSRVIPDVVLIDDAEDGDSSLISGDEAAYQGYWYTYDDRQECDNPDIVAGMAEVCGVKVCAASGDTSPLPDPQGGEGFAMTDYAEAGAPPAPIEGDQKKNTKGIRVTGGGNVGFGAGLGVGLNNPASPQVYDATVPGFTTVRFQARGTPGMQLKVKIKDAYSEPLGGLCLERQNLCDDVMALTCTCGGATKQGCHDDPALDTTKGDPDFPPLTDTWTLYTIPLSKLVRGNWGEHLPDMAPPDGMLDLARVYQLQFEVMRPNASTSTDPLPPFELWLDNVGFGTGDPPAPPAGTPPTAAPSGT